jgi:hypothetical protein
MAAEQKVVCTDANSTFFLETYGLFPMRNAGQAEATP